jgi:hypothetical protein
MGKLAAIVEAVVCALFAAWLGGCSSAAPAAAGPCPFIGGAYSVTYVAAQSGNAATCPDLSNTTDTVSYSLAADGTVAAPAGYVDMTGPGSAGANELQGQCGAISTWDASTDPSACATPAAYGLNVTFDAEGFTGTYFRTACNGNLLRDTGEGWPCWYQVTAVRQ